MRCLNRDARRSAEHPDQRAAHRACRKLAFNLRPRREGSTWKSWSRLMSSRPPAPARSCCALAFCPSFIHPATCARVQSVRSSLFRAQNADAAGGRGVGLGRSQTSSARMVLALRDWSALAAAPLPVLRIFSLSPTALLVRCFFKKGKGGRLRKTTRITKNKRFAAHSFPDQARKRNGSAQRARVDCLWFSGSGQSRILCQRWRSGHRCSFWRPPPFAPV